MDTPNPGSCLPILNVSLTGTGFTEWLPRVPGSTTKDAHGEYGTSKQLENVAQEAVLFLSKKVPKLNEGGDGFYFTEPKASVPVRI